MNTSGRADLGIPRVSESGAGGPAGTPGAPEERRRGARQVPRCREVALQTHSAGRPGPLQIRECGKRGGLRRGRDAGRTDQQDRPTAAPAAAGQQRAATSPLDPPAAGPGASDMPPRWVLGEAGGTGDSGGPVLAAGSLRRILGRGRPGVTGAQGPGMGAAAPGRQARDLGTAVRRRVHGGVSGRAGSARTWAGATRGSEEKRGELAGGRAGRQGRCPGTARRLAAGRVGPGEELPPRGRDAPTGCGRR